MGKISLPYNFHQKYIKKLIFEKKDRKFENININKISKAYKVILKTIN